MTVVNEYSCIAGITEDVDKGGGIGLVLLLTLTAGGTTREGKDATEELVLSWGLLATVLLLLPSLPFVVVDVVVVVIEELLW